MGKEWIEDIKEKVLELSKKTGKNVNYVVGIKKTEVEILKVSHEISKIYKVIGELVYNAHEENTDANIDTLCKQVGIKKRYIHELEKRIEYIKEKKRIDDSDKLYEDIPDFVTSSETEEDIAVLKFCPECNTGNELDNEVCKKCGKKLSKKKK